MNPVEQFFFIFLRHKLQFAPIVLTNTASKTLNLNLPDPQGNGLRPRGANTILSRRRSMVKSIAMIYASRRDATLPKKKQQETICAFRHFSGTLVSDQNSTGSADNSLRFRKM